MVRSTVSREQGGREAEIKLKRICMNEYYNVVIHCTSYFAF